jgi:transcription termination factor Rho
MRKRINQEDKISNREESNNQENNEEIIPAGPVVNLKELRRKSPEELQNEAESMKIEHASTMTKQELVVSILKTVVENGGSILGEGVLEVLPDGFGFLRAPEANYSAGPDDIYISPNQIRRCGLKTGDTIEGHVRAPKPGERYFALIKATQVNFEPTPKVMHRVHFDDLTPLYPEQKLNLEVQGSKDLSNRIIELVSPLGKGQRALIVAPPRTGKTTLMQNIAHAITTNHPEVYLIVLLIDERPEEVTDMQRSVKGEVVKLYI